MALQQLRTSIKRLIVPTADLGLGLEPSTPLVFPDDLPPVLAVLSGLGPSDPKILRTDSSGRLLTGTQLVDANGNAYTAAAPLPTTGTGVTRTTVMLVAQQNITVNTQSPFVSCAGWEEAFILMVIGVPTGTTPTITVSIVGSPDGGAHSCWIGQMGGSGISATAALGVSLGIGAIQPNAANGSLFSGGAIPQQIAFNFAVGGTTPSFPMLIVASVR